MEQVIANLLSDFERGRISRRSLISSLAVTATAAAVPALATMTHANLPATGLLLDGTPWAAEPFVEGVGLHFKPAIAAGVVGS